MDDQDRNGNPQPRKNGFCIFRVPHFLCHAGPCCSLYYRQKEHNADGPWANLVVTRLTCDPLVTASDSVLFWNAWYGNTIALDCHHDNDTWYAIPLTPMACIDIANIAAQPNGGYYQTGWVTTDTADYIFTTAYGAGETCSPYIKVISP
jgi:hypothetical protein